MEEKSGEWRAGAEEINGNWKAETKKERGGQSKRVKNRGRGREWGAESGNRDVEVQRSGAEEERLGAEEESWEQGVGAEEL